MNGSMVLNGARLPGNGPMIVSVNGAVASLAVTKFMTFVTGLRLPAAQLTYRGDQQVIRRSSLSQNRVVTTARGLGDQSRPVHEETNTSSWELLS